MISPILLVSAALAAPNCGSSRCDKEVYEGRKVIVTSGEIPSERTIFVNQFPQFHSQVLSGHTVTASPFSDSLEMSKPGQGFAISRSKVVKNDGTLVEDAILWAK